ncbi:MAG: hypothetical protein GX875_09955 [Propionibacterium sp.]|nr:hypothetical protein [Propionibacterium sp.]
MEMSRARNLFARPVFRTLDGRRRRSEETGVPDLNVEFLYNMPFLTIAKMTGGVARLKMVDAVVDIVNGSSTRSLKRLVAGLFANRKANKETLAQVVSDR